jgi:hypothetical protein
VGAGPGGPARDCLGGDDTQDYPRQPVMTLAEAFGALLPQPDELRYVISTGCGRGEGS